MVKRLISADASDIQKMSASDLKQSIRASEGRVVMTETVAIRPSFIGDITNAEIATSFGSDMILLNGVDVLEPHICGLKDQVDPIKQLKNLTGRPIGVNLEPVDQDAQMAQNKLDISEGRQVNEKTAKALDELGFDFVCITGNPGTGVTVKEIAKAITLIKEYYSGLVIAGKMHGAGVSEPVADYESLRSYIDAGADILLVPAVGTIPGFDYDDLKNAVKYAHENDALVVSAIGTSQEGADEDTIKRIAIDNKICGVDIQHIGDAGYNSLAPVQNIFAMSNAIRGIRHTVSRMARSVNR